MTGRERTDVILQTSTNILNNCGGDVKAAKDWMCQSFKEYQEETGEELSVLIRCAYLRALDLVAAKQQANLTKR